ncbi:DUF3037 domain-containing protein [Pediococcus acidilactici]|uniref:DUF3037 domain-containing protein n=1 Tax=Pediococcus acidilactici TaxID=1254 RepID=UPI0023300F0F|nr:DUF3037 domain-containing protein [Pediococcus acidilactici]MDB8867838.1 DUF3037 domain-containing protein [Pediococcus acidilactici]
MTNNDLLFSVAKYTPDLVRDESINVGIVIHVPAYSYSSFIPTKNKRRIRSFDDEYDSEYMDMILDSLEFEFNSNEIDNYSFDNRFNSIKSNNFIAEKTKYYANELRFSKVQRMLTNNLEVENDIKDLIDTYLYYDKPKNKRITKQKVNSLLRKRIKNLNLEEHIRPSKKKMKYFDSKIFDFETSSTYIKTIALDYKKQSYLYDELKRSIFDIKFADTLENKKIDFVVNNGPDEEFYKLTKKILKHYINKEINLLTIADYVSQIEEGNY